MIQSSLDLEQFRGASVAEPLSILFSACLLSERCGWTGDAYTVDRVKEIASLPNVRPVRFCPEQFAFGTPRPFSAIHGGDGLDVLNHRAQVIATSGADWTEGSIAGAQKMLEIARAGGARLAILLDISPSCGSRVIYNGVGEETKYRQGLGVSAALLARNGCPILTHRDERFLEELLAILEPGHLVDESAVNHFEDSWYREYFAPDQALER